MKPENLEKEVAEILNSYATEVRKEVETSCQEVATECAQQLRENSPTRTGKYAKGWEAKEVSGGQVRQSTWVVWNRKHYRLTHLLERGHALRNGGRTEAQEHIKPVEEWAQDELPKVLNTKLGGN